MPAEHQWAVALKKAQNNSKKTGLTIEARKEQLNEEMAHFKAELKKHISARDPRINSVLRALFELRAEQALLKMQEFKNKYGFADENIAKKETRLYFQDCMRLSKAARQKLS